MTELEIQSQLEQNQVLIKVAYSTCNPIDKIWYYITKTEGFTLGSDGSGTIIGLGESVDRSLLGKKVAFNQGAWAHYKVADADDLILLDDTQDLSRAANAIVNPLTVM